MCRVRSIIFWRTSDANTSFPSPNQVTLTWSSIFFPWKMKNFAFLVTFSCAWESINMTVFILQIFSIEWKKMQKGKACISAYYSLIVNKGIDSTKSLRFIVSATYVTLAITDSWNVFFVCNLHFTSINHGAVTSCLPPFFHWLVWKCSSQTFAQSSERDQKYYTLYDLRSDPSLRLIFSIRQNSNSEEGKQKFSRATFCRMNFLTMPMRCNYFLFCR